MNRLAWMGCVALALAGCNEVKPERATSNFAGIKGLISVTQLQSQNADGQDLDGAKPEGPQPPPPPKKGKKAQ